MKPRYGQFNPKRRLLKADLLSAQRERLAQLAEKVQYGGNPEHKKNPGDFGLHPPSDPRRGKSLCDVVDVFRKAEARKLLQEGLRRGMVSDREQNGWPKNVWSVSANGVALESQLENPDQGTYHGYPMPESDPFSDEIKRVWDERRVED